MARSQVDSAQRNRALSAPVTLLALVQLLVACASSSGPETISLPAVPAKPAAAPGVAAAPQPATGFTPLPTPQQVVAALPTGRIDPFAPLAQPRAAAATASTGDLRFTGVIRSAGRVQALVQVGDQSGAVCVGRRGVCPGSGLPALLPPDWAVTSIDVASGRMVLNQAGQKRVFNL